MPVQNEEVAGLFNRLADLLEIEDDNPFRVRAYRNAARVVGGMGENVSDMVREGQDMTALPGIGKDLAEKITEIVRTGRMKALEEMEKKIPPELANLLNIPGIGPKRVQALYHNLNITDWLALKRAAENGEVRSLPGFGKKTEQMILDRIIHAAEEKKRFLLPQTERIAESLVEYLTSLAGVRKVTPAGSLRRRKETIGDLDILVICEDSETVMEQFTRYEDVVRVDSVGDTRASVELRGGMNVDLRIVPEESYGAALHYFTGSKAHNVALRRAAQSKGLKVNEYGVFREEEQIAGWTEEEVFTRLGLSYIVPELREDRGEIEAAREDRLPRLVKAADIRGDLHAHTTETDGRSSIAEMVAAARERGYAYLSISDHTRNVTVANGMDVDRILRQMDEIDRMNEKIGGFPTLLKSAEVDILKDGSLDLPDDVLQRLDIRVCSIHSKFNLPVEEQTERVIRAMDNPWFNILGHPTGRILNFRPPYEIDLERIIRAAGERGCFLELNAHPDRLDLTDRHCRLAREHGVKIAISTDAHRASHLRYISYGIGQARRGWLEPDDVLNTRSLTELKKLLNR